jgi:putative effector of murein hydrolase LrgA (UPF0299 family)
VDLEHFQLVLLHLLLDFSFQLLPVAELDGLVQRHHFFLQLVAVVAPAELEVDTYIFLLGHMVLLLVPVEHHIIHQFNSHFHLLVEKDLILIFLSHHCLLKDLGLMPRAVVDGADSADP